MALPEKLPVQVLDRSYVEGILDRMNDGVLVVDDHAHVVVYANPAASQLLARPAYALVGQPLGFALPEADKAMLELATGTRLELQCSPMAWPAQRPGSGNPIQARLIVMREPASPAQADTRTAQQVHAERERSGWNRASGRWWKSIFYATRMGIVVSGPDGKLMELVNPAYADMHGYTREELIGQPILMVVDPQEYARFAARTDEIHTRDHFTVESLHVRKDGTTFPTMVDITRVRDEDGSVLYYVLNVQDITARKQAEEARALSDRHSRVVAQNIPDGDIFLIGQDQRFISAGGTVMGRFGLTPEHFLGRTIHEALDPAFLDVLAPLHERALAGHEGERELEFMDRVYRLRTVPIRNDQGHVYECMVLTQDITKLKETELEIRSLNTRLAELLRREQAARTAAEQRRALLQDIVDRAPTMMCLLHGPEHVYQYVNENYCRGVGRTESELLGKTVREALPELASAGVCEIFDCVYRHAWTFHAAEQLVPLDLAKSGTTEDRYFTFVYQPMYESHGEVSGIIVHAIDITDSVRARRSLEQKNREVEDLSRELEQRVVDRTAQLEAANQELEAFAHSVSHDLRAPLRRIDAFCHALNEAAGSKLDGPARNHLTRIRAASQHMGALIDDLLALARISQSEMHVRAVSLSDMVRHILAVLQEHGRDRTVATIIEPDVVVQGDAKFLKIALENLLDNAWKFTSKTADATIEFGVMDERGEPVYFVRDNGAGFDPAFASKLFRTFSRLHAAAEFPGTGVGLATVKRVIERHCGRIWAEGAPGRGAAFYFTLPGPST